MKIRAIVFGTEGITEQTVSKLHYRCYHNSRSNFLSFEEPVLFELSNERMRKYLVAKLSVSKRMIDMFMYEDSIFSTILEAIPKLPLKRKCVTAREVAKLLQQIDPVDYGNYNEVNPYEVKMKSFSVT